MWWNILKKRELILRDEFSKLLFRALDHYAEPLLDTEYTLFDDVADFLRVCPRPKRHRKGKYDCNRQVAEIVGKLQGYAIGGLITPWRTGGKKINHSLLVVCFKDIGIRLFDVNARRLYKPNKTEVVKLWL